MCTMLSRIELHSVSSQYQRNLLLAFSFPLHMKWFFLFVVLKRLEGPVKYNHHLVGRATKIGLFH